MNFVDGQRENPHDYREPGERWPRYHTEKLAIPVRRDRKGNVCRLLDGDVGCYTRCARGEPYTALKFYAEAGKRVLHRGGLSGDLQRDRVRPAGSEAATRVLRYEIGRFTVSLKRRKWRPVERCANTDTEVFCKKKRKRKK